MKEPGIQEPSVLDYLKSLLTPWKGKPIPFPGEQVDLPEMPAPSQPSVDQSFISDQIFPVEETKASVKTGAIAIPWRILMALPVALLAQWAFAPPNRSPELGIIFLVFSTALVGWSVLSGELKVSPIPRSEKQRDDLKVKVPSLVIGGLLAAMAFIASGGGEFNWLNLSLFGLSLIFLLHAYWKGNPAILERTSSAAHWIARSKWQIQVSPWDILILAVTALVLYFRLSQLDTVPPEMVSDHAEKYLDVNLIFNGNPRIFFPRNGGREAMQFYLLAALVHFFNAPQTFLTLKISTVIIGIMSLPYIYLLGNEISNRRVALIAFSFAGIAYWTNVVARAGMRLPFYMLFSAAVLYHLLRGIRSGNRNQFILAGIFLGLGFYGYSADRLLPAVVIIAVALYLVHRQSQGIRKQTIWQTVLLALMAFVVFLPLLRYILYDPAGFSQRMVSRMSGTEQALAGPAFLIFLDNLWRALRMFSWTAGVVWGVSIPDYPALCIVAGGAFYLGLAMALVRYLRELNWLDLFLILSIPLLMLPSILSLAFPAENPNLYRTGGAMVPVFLLVGIALDSIMSSLERHLKCPWGRRVAWGLIALLFGLSALQNYHLVFDKYNQQYRTSAWNYSEMGAAIRSFSDTIGTPETAWLMGYPHWADTRLVAIEAGFPERDYAMFAESLENTVQDPRAKLFLVNPQDEVAKLALLETYPNGWFETFESSVPGKDFLLFFAPPQE